MARPGFERNPPLGRPPLASFGNAGIGFFTLDDPKAYTRPFTVRIDQRLVADGSELIEFITLD
jgi:hypothetical protein